VTLPDSEAGQGYDRSVTFPLATRPNSRWLMRPFATAVLMLWVAGACVTETPPTNSDAVAACGSGAQMLRVAQGPMDPTLQSGDVVAVVPLGLLGSTRGDIVAIVWPTWTGDAGPDATMRVIGTAGDHIELSAGTVILNGSALAEPYLEADTATNPVPDGESDWIVADGSVFVLGDGRQNAADSRVYGLVPNGALLGRIVFRCGPAGRSGPVS
jgi:signal peptidase I